MPFIFGNSYDSLQATRKGYDDLAVQMAERDRQARTEAFKQAQDAQIFAQRQSEEDARQRQAQAYQFSQAAQSEQDRQNEMSRRAFEFGVTSKQHDDSENRIAKSEADRLQLQKDTNATNLKLGNEDADYREAVNRIHRGLISHPSDIDTLFPNMNTDQKARAASYWKEQNDKAHEDYQSLTGYAKAANSLIQSDNKTGLPLSEDDAYALLAKDKNAKKWLPNLRFDEASQQWTPSMPKPFTVPPPVPPTAVAGPTSFQMPFTPGSARIPFPGSVTPDAPVVAPAPAPVAPTPPPAPSNFWSGAKAFGTAAMNRFAFPGVNPVFGPLTLGPEANQTPPVPAPAPAPVAPTSGTTTNGFSFQTNSAPTIPAKPAAPMVDQDGMVRVKSPDGRTGRIPAAKYQAALAAGWMAVSDVPIQ